MAKVIATFDTVEKTLSVTNDGKAVADISEVFMGRGYRDDGKYACSLTTAREDKDHKTTVYTRMVANDQGEMVPSDEAASKAQADIEKFFSE